MTDILMPDQVDAFGERAKSIVRHYSPGGCRIMSEGSGCKCFLCDTDRVTATIRAQAARIEEQDDELAAIARDVQDRVEFYEKEASVQDDDDEREGYEEYATMWRRFAFKHELMEQTDD